MIDTIVDWLVTHAIWLFNALISTSLGFWESIFPKISSVVVVIALFYFFTEMID